MPRSRAALAEAIEREREMVLAFRRSASEDLAETEVDVARRRELLNAAQDQEQRTVVGALGDDELRGLGAAMQGIEGEDTAGDIEPADEAPGAEDFAAGAVGGDLPGDHAGAVGDGGEAHTRIIGATRTVERSGLAADGQGALRGWRRCMSAPRHGRAP